MFAEQDKRLKFRVVHCSSEDERHKISELYVHNQTTKGWQSHNMCVYPQEIGVKFEGIANVSKIQFLSHQYKIASKIELFVGVSEQGTSSYNSVKWKRLGYLSLDSNERTNYTARELKSVQINTTAEYLKMLLYKPHVNEHNMLQQVGLIAVNVVGFISDPESKPQSAVSRPNPPVSRTPTPSSSTLPTSSHGFSRPPSTPVTPVNGEPYQDPYLVNKIRELTKAKVAAVEVENFVLAKQLKSCIDYIKNLALEVGQMVLSKKQAVANEDYDAATTLKTRIDQLRLQALSMIPDYPGKDPTEIERFQTQLQQEKRTLARESRSIHPSKETTMGTVEFTTSGKNGFPSQPAEVPAEERSMPSTARKLDHNDMVIQPTTVLHPDDRPLPTLMKKGSFNSNPFAEPPDQTTNIPYDERPIGVKKPMPEYEPSKAAQKRNTNKKQSKNKVDPPKVTKQITEEASIEKTHEEEEEQLPEEIIHRSQEMQIKGGKQFDFGEEHAPSDFVPRKETLPDPEPIPQGKMKDAEALIQIFGEKTVQSFYSKTWVLRENALKTIESNLTTLEGDKVLVMKNIMFVLTTTLKDKITHVYYASLSLLQSVVTGIAADMKKSILIPMLGETISGIVEKTGDSNQKTKELSSETVLFLAAQPNIGPTYMCHQILHKASKSQGWKPTIGRLDLLINLIPRYGFGEENGVPKGVIPFIVGVFDNPNQDARTAAILAIMEAYKLDPKTTEMYTDKVKPQIKAILDEKFAELKETMKLPNKNPSSSKPKPTKDHAPSNTKSQKEPQQSHNSKANAKPQAKEQPQKQSNQSVKSKSVAPPEEPQSPTEEEEEFQVETGTCQFCGETDPSKQDQEWDAHYMNDCPMLTVCDCQQVIEVATLDEHRLQECDRRDLFALCMDCKVILPVTDMASHRTKKRCKVAKANSIRCPLCISEVGTNEEDLRKHLFTCQENPRARKA